MVFESVHAPLFGPPCILCNAALLPILPYILQPSVFFEVIQCMQLWLDSVCMIVLLTFPIIFFSFYIVYGIQRLRFISCFIKQWLIDWHFVRYVSANHADGEFEFHDLYISSDEKLFNKILTCPNHILWTRLPPPTAQNYSLRNRNTSTLLF